jgi:hypothetical protein
MKAVIEWRDRKVTKVVATTGRILVIPPTSLHRME